MSNNQIYPPDQIKKAISILEAMLEPNAPDLSIEFDLYYKYMEKCAEYRVEISHALRSVDSMLKRKNVPVQNNVENINTSQP